VAMVARDPDRRRLVIIPERRTLPRGTVRAIVEQAGMSREEFLKLLRES
jgi:predicted RNA binding protein YcfA (HicA-like mRNA interferase family)